MGVGVGFSLGSGWKAADWELIRASVATLVFPTESPLKSTCARWSEGSLFGHWRSGVAFAQVSCRSTRRGVREHPAPSGALRPSGRPGRRGGGRAGQGAPSTIRCIETRNGSRLQFHRHSVREHPAPSGALRHRCTPSPYVYSEILVREHPAPSGALRRAPRLRGSSGLQGQGAPSTIRCIQTDSPPRRHITA